VTDAEWDILDELERGELKWGAAVGEVWGGLVRAGYVQPNFGEITELGRRMALVRRADRISAREKRRDAVEGPETAGLIEALVGQIATLSGAVGELLLVVDDHVVVPDRNCSCHLEPPCGDCETWSYARETLEKTRRLV
jgi:hypothetical protein